MFSFRQHGLNDGMWKKYRLTMNRTEVAQHRREAGTEWLSITVKAWLGSGGRGHVVLDNLNVTSTNTDLKHNILRTQIHSNIDAPSPTTTTKTTTTIRTTATENSTASRRSGAATVWTACTAGREVGPCRARFPRYYYSLTADACVKFSWSGCGGNQNNFLSEEACLDACVGSSTSPAPSLIEHTDTPTQAGAVCWLPAHPGRCTTPTTVSWQFYFK